MSNEQELKNKINELEKLLQQREEDLATYRGELQQANVKLESLIANLSRDIKILSKIQKSLVPTEFPHIQGFHFSTKFIPSAVSGGDYLDIFEHHDQLKFSLVMSSASGYSLSALLLSSLLGLSSFIDNDKDQGADVIIKEVLGEVKELVAGEDQGELFLGVLNRRTLVLNYTLMGDVYVFHLPYADKKLHHIEETSESFSKDFNLAELNSGNISLNAKDRLVICSRGVIEAANLEDEPFSIERLVHILMGNRPEGVHDLRNEILFQVQQHCQGAQPNRDQSVIVLEVKDKVLKLAT